MKRLKLFFFVLVLVSLSILLLSGCGDDSLWTKDEMLELVSKSVPNSSFVSMEHQDTSDDFGKNLYTFTNDEFTYEIENYMYRDSTFGITNNDIRTNYLYQLIKYHYEDLKALALENNIVLIADSVEGNEYRQTYKIMELLAENEGKSVISLRVSNFGTYSQGNDLKLYIYLGDFSGIDNVYNYLNEFHDYLKVYYPKVENRELNFYLDYRIYAKNYSQASVNISYITNDPLQIHYTSIGSLLNSDLPITALEKSWVQHDFAFQVRMKKVEDSVLSYEGSLEYNPIIINRLDIEGELYECSENFNFVYNIEDGCYYSDIYGGFGLDGSEKEQKKFLEFIYDSDDLDYLSDYTENYTSYTIEGIRYKILQQRNGNDLEFYRNGKDLKVDVRRDFAFLAEPLNTRFYISLEDFAKVFGLKVDKVDRITGVIYFSKLGR